MTPFKHTPLDSLTGDIRLLVLDLSGELDEVRCTLTTQSLDEQPIYCALSYEWGDPEPLVAIMVNGSVFYARHNLWLFLHRLKAAGQHENSRRSISQLWIDAICIDQADVVERNAQVQLMGRIYQEACGVIV
jgi:Heterokaryon incompatibility protein (HET)